MKGQKRGTGYFSLPAPQKAACPPFTRQEIMNTTRILIITFLLSIAALCAAAEDNEYYMITEKQAQDYVEKVKKSKQNDVLRQRDAVPDKESAIGLALVVWKSIYGKEKIEKQAPYQAIRVNDCWYVSGSLPRGWRGGTAEAVIRAKDGSFLNVFHGK